MKTSVQLRIRNTNIKNSSGRCMAIPKKRVTRKAIVYTKEQIAAYIAAKAMG